MNSQPPGRIKKLQTLLQFIRKDNLDEIEKLVTTYPEIINAWYGFGDNDVDTSFDSHFPRDVQLNIFKMSGISSESYGITPLNFACILGKVDIAKLLLKHGADPTIPAVISGYFFSNMFICNYLNTYKHSLIEECLHGKVEYNVSEHFERIPKDVLRNFKYDVEEYSHNLFGF